MFRRKSSLDKAREQAEAALERVNEKIEELGESSLKMYIELGVLQSLFSKIRNIPEEERREFERLNGVRLEWKQQAEKIEKDYEIAQAKALGKGAAGAGVGIAVVALGPTAAMGVATTFGVASTGTAIAALNGAAATNAALAWLGGGALATGGGGMAAGSAFLSMAGPIGWAIAGVALLGSGLMILRGRHDKKRLERVFTLVSERDVRTYNLAIVEIEERIRRMDDEGEKIDEAIDRIATFGFDYQSMTEAQQYELGAYVNLLLSSTQLLVNPIIGLQPKFPMQVLDDCERSKRVFFRKSYRPLILSLCNLLHGIDTDSEDRKLLVKALKKNEEFLSGIGLQKKDFDETVFAFVDEIVSYRQGKS